MKFNSTWGFVFVLMISFSNCGGPDIAFDPTGVYKMTVQNKRGTYAGQLELVGRSGDYFGELLLEYERPRKFAVGGQHVTADSMIFFLPGDGYLRLYQDSLEWSGDFKYFGLTAEISAVRDINSISKLNHLTGLKPIARNVISTRLQETFPTVNASGDKMIFTREDVIMESRFDGSSWSMPDTLKFSGSYPDRSPYFIPGSEDILFTSRRPPINSGSSKPSSKNNLWKVNYNKASYDLVSPLPHPVNVDTIGDYHGSISGNGTIYFISYGRPGGFGRSDIYRAELVNGKYEVNNLGGTINTEKSEADVFIDPEERFLLFAATDF